MTKNPIIQYEQLTLDAKKLRASADSLRTALDLTEAKIADIYAETLALDFDKTSKEFQLVETEWAKNFKATNPTQYIEALQYALHPEFSVIINLSNQLEVPLFAIVAVIDGVSDDFWMSAFDNVEDALSLCQEMGWEHTLIGT
jgi:hypothetical protein